MLVALLTFAFSITQVVVAKDYISEHMRFRLGLTFALVSAVPVLLQLLILVGELWRAGRHFFKLLVQRLIRSCLGDYGAGAPLLLKHLQRKDYSSLRIREYPQVFWGFLLFATRALMKPFPPTCLTFGDAFSGEYQLKNQSVALWMTDEAEPWKEWYGREEPLDEAVWTDSFEDSKEIRDVKVIWGFDPYATASESSPLEGNASANQSTSANHGSGGPDGGRSPDGVGFVRVRPEGSGFLGKLYFDLFSKHEVPGRNYIAFCKLMKAVNDDTFFVSLTEEEERKVRAEQDYLTLRCLDMESIMKSILTQGRKVKGKKLRYVSYV